MIKHPKRFFTLMIILLGIYVALTIVVKPSQAALDLYHLSTTKAYAIILSVDVLSAVIWLSAAWGFVQLLSYSQITQHAKDGRAFQKVAWGLGLIAFRQPINSIMSNVFGYLLQAHPHWLPTTRIITNYVGVAIALFGFGLIYMGSEQLVALTRKRQSPWPRVWFRLIGLVLITIYTYLAIGQGGNHTSAAEVSRVNFYMPSWLIVSTIIVPYAYSWYMAITASYNLAFYGRHIKGILYKQALRWVAVGINIVVLNTIFLQFLSAQNSRLNKLDLGPLLILVYVALLTLAAGFIVIAIGAKKLRRIEEV